MPRRPLLARARLRRLRAPGPRLRRRLVALTAIAALLAALYMVWLRDSSLVAVERVEVTGLTTADADRVRAALTSSATTMTTLHIDREALEQAASAFPVVAGIEVVPDFPDGLAVHVTEHRPVAMLALDGDRVPVAADGTLLVGVTVEGDVPSLTFDGSPPAGRLPPGATREAALLAGAAPAVIARRVETIAPGGDDEHGLVAQLESGPEIVFGDASRAGAKWAAAVRVLADEGAGGAAYVDVRLPERPVAGGFSATDPYAAAPATEYDPVTGLAIDPATGQAVDPATGLPIDPATGLPVDPATGLPFDPSTGVPINL
jgi:cell division protein FtsQ